MNFEEPLAPSRSQLGTYPNKQLRGFSTNRAIFKYIKWRIVVLVMILPGNFWKFDLFLYESILFRKLAVVAMVGLWPGTGPIDGFNVGPEGGAHWGFQRSQPPRSASKPILGRCTTFTDIQVFLVFLSS